MSVCVLQCQKDMKDTLNRYHIMLVQLALEVCGYAGDAALPRTPSPLAFHKVRKYMSTILRG